MPDTCPHCDYLLAGGQCANCGRDPSEPVDRCESCGVPWLRHLGIQGTCAELQRLRNALHAILMVEHTLPLGKTSHVIENKRRREIAIEALKKRKEPK